MTYRAMMFQPGFGQGGGSKGDPGEQGPKGDKGDKGDTGEQGPPGQDASDPWTYVKLAQTAATTATGNTATALGFTPEANAHYIFEGMLFVQAAATTTGARPGISWPSGTVQESAWMLSPNNATAFASRFWGAPTTSNASATGVAIANEGLHARFEGQLITGASPSGSLAITIASEVAGSEARIMANSWLRWRTI